MRARLAQNGAGMKTISDQSLSSFTEAIAAPEPAPGSGAAAGAALALGIACMRKALRITLKHHPERAGLAEAESRLRAIGAEALAAGEGDARCFEAVLHD